MSGRYPKLDDRDWLAAQYGQAGRSLRDIASEVGCSFPTVRVALGRHGIAVRPRSVPTHPQLADVAWLRDQLIARRRTIGEVAAEVGCTDRGVQEALRRAGVRVRAERAAARGERPLPAAAGASS